MFGKILSHCSITFQVSKCQFILQFQGVYKFNQANFQEIPGGILRKIQDMFALLRPPSEISGSVISSPQVSRAQPRPKTILVHLELEKTHLMAINFVFMQQIFIHIFMTGNQCGRSSTSYIKISRRID